MREEGEEEEEEGDGEEGSHSDLHSGRLQCSNVPIRYEKPLHYKFISSYKLVTACMCNQKLFELFSVFLFML